MSLAKLRLA